MKPRLLKLGLYIGSVLLLMGYFTAKAARADLAVSPIYVELSANLGKAEGVLNISNSGDQPIRVRLSTSAFTYNRDGEFQSLTKSDHDLTPYLQYSPREVVVLPRKLRRVRLLSLLSPNQPDGEYRVVIFAETLSPGTDQNGYRINLISRIGSAVYVRKGKVSPDLQVQKASFDAQKQQLRLLVNNQGLATARPQIRWSLQQGSTLLASENIGTSIIAGLEQNILLNRSQYKKLNLASGEYKLSGELFWQEGNGQKTIPFNVELVIPSSSK